MLNPRGIFGTPGTGNPIDLMGERCKQHKPHDILEMLVQGHFSRKKAEMH